MDKRNLYHSFLEDILLMQLATARDNKPWLCSVWYVMDDDNNIYWLSRKTRRHSEELADNSYASCTFTKQYHDGFGIDKGQALVASGTVEILMGDDCVTPYKLYTSCHPKMLEFQTLEDVKTDQGHHYLYKLTPEEIVWFDELNFPQDPRQVLK